MTPGRVAAGRVRTRGSSGFTRSWHGAGPFFENGPVFRGGAVPYFQKDPRGGSIFEDPPRPGYYPEDPRVLYISNGYYPFQERVLVIGTSLNHYNNIITI